MSVASMSRLLRIVFAVMVLAMVAGFLLNQYQSAKQKQVQSHVTAATLLDKPRTISEFSFTDEQHQSFTKQQLLGQWTMMFFGFTYCQHMCPMTMAELKQMAQSLTDKDIKNPPQVVFISIDPERDSVEKLADYVHGFDKRFKGAVGDNQQVSRLAREVGVVYDQDVKKDPNTNYDIIHSGAIILFNPQGELAGFFNYPQKAADLAADMSDIVRRTAS